jgi:hypothetical protein
VTAGAGPSQTTLIGGGPIGGNTTSGARLTLGWWFGPEHIWGLEASGFFLGQNSRNEGAGGMGNTIVGRPFVFQGLPTTINGIAVNPGDVLREFVSQPGVAAGVVNVEHTTSLWGAELNLMRGLLCCDRGYLNVLVGYRHLGLDESLTIDETVMAVSPNLLRSVPAGATFSVEDRFSTHNRFYGGQIGVAGEYRFNRLSIGMQAKVALGLTQQWGDINGFTVLQSGGAVTTGAGGLLGLQGTNIGHYYHSKFGVVPEGTFTIGYDITTWCRATIGYNFLYWSNVIRPGGLIDPGVNPTFIPGAPGGPVGPARPAPMFTTTEFWAQGLTLGLQFRW